MGSGTRAQAYVLPTIRGAYQDQPIEVIHYRIIGDNMIASSRNNPSHADRP